MEAVAEHEHESAHTIEHTVHGVAQGKGIVEDWLYAEDSSSDDESAEDPAGRGNRLAASYVRYEDDEDAAGTHGGIGATVYDHYGSAAHGADGESICCKAPARFPEPFASTAVATPHTLSARLFTPRRRRGAAMA